MKNFKEAVEIMEDLCENRYFEKSEIKVLEKYYGRKIDFAYPGWVVFVNNGKHDYCRYFNNDETELMLSLAEKRVAKVREIAEKIDACQTDEEIMEICANIMMDYAKSWNNRETCSYEMEHRKKILTSIESIKIVQGRHNYEKCKPYSAINVGDRGVVVIRKMEDGKYRISRRVPLCGECCGNYDSMHIQKEMIDFLLFIS